MQSQITSSLFSYYSTYTIKLHMHTTYTRDKLSHAKQRRKSRLVT